LIVFCTTVKPITDQKNILSVSFYTEYTKKIFELFSISSNSKNYKQLAKYIFLVYCGSGNWNLFKKKYPRLFRPKNKIFVKNNFYRFIYQ